MFTRRWTLEHLIPVELKDIEILPEFDTGAAVDSIRDYLGNNLRRNPPIGIS